jgi:hypothetical protein
MVACMVTLHAIFRSTRLSLEAKSLITLIWSRLPSIDPVMNECGNHTEDYRMGAKGCIFLLGT